jgi:hypothetical protein
MNRNALSVSLVISTALQVAMVVAGHWSPAIAGLYAIGGMGFSLVGGVIYALMAKPDWKEAIGMGALVGGVSGLIGIAVSYAFGDVPASLLALGTVSSAATGFVGAAVTRMFVKP